MAGRGFGTYDSSPFRVEANVDPFKNYVQGGMQSARPMGTNQGMAKAPALNSQNMETLLPLLLMLMNSRGKGNLMQNILAMLGGKR